MDWCRLQGIPVVRVLSEALDPGVRIVRVAATAYRVLLPNGGYVHAAARWWPTGALCACVQWMPA